MRRPRPRLAGERASGSRETESVVVRTSDSGGLGPGASREQPDGVTQQWLELRGLAQVCRALTEGQARFALAETERAQGSGSSELPVRSVW